MSRFRIDRVGEMFAVFVGTRQVSPASRSEAQALRRLDEKRRIEARAKRGGDHRRNCLCCDVLFVSDGPHERLCPRCRGSARALDTQMVEPCTLPR